MDESPTQRAERMGELARTEYPGMSRKMRRGFTKYVEKRSRDMVKGSLNHFHNKHAAQWAVTCFSAIGDSLLMWAHYADSHRGICLIFDETLTPSPFVAFKVYYSDRRPLHPENDSDAMEGFKKTVLTKGSDWAYEQECRMMDYVNPAGYRSFPRQALRGVILGARISDENASFVRGLILRRETRIDVFKSRIHDDEFRIDIEPIR
jgi:hypothetical protein